jgi:lysophospholipase L1-like esterase
MLIVGASYTQGLGATTRSAGYAYQVGGRLGWRTDVDGVSGTGFVNPGPHDEGTFGQRLARITPPFEPTMVLIQGGRNDAGIPVATLRTAVDGTVSLCHHRFPKAEVAFLGPVPGKLPLDPAVSEVEHVLRDAAADDHVVFIDPIAEQWIDEGNLRGFTGPVAGHPNDAGYAYIAQRLAVDLKDWQQNDTV